MMTKCFHVLGKTMVKLGQLEHVLLGNQRVFYQPKPLYENEVLLQDNQGFIESEKAELVGSEPGNKSYWRDFLILD